jgi:hypothetical protein
LACVLQLGLAREVSDLPKVREFLWRLAEAHDREGDSAKAEQYLKDLLQMDLTKKQQLEALVFLADIQVRRVVRTSHLISCCFPCAVDQVCPSALSEGGTLIAELVAGCQSHCGKTSLVS